MRRSFPWPSAPQESKDSCRVLEGSVGAASGWGRGYPQVMVGPLAAYHRPSSGLKLASKGLPQWSLVPKGQGYVPWKSPSWT